MGTFFESLANFSDPIKEDLLRESPHVQFRGELPPELQFLAGSYTDLGFENLGLPEREWRAIGLAFIHHGVGVPSANYKLRSLGNAAVVEPRDGSEVAELPRHWAQGVLVIAANMQHFKWVGKLTRPSQLQGWNIDNYDDVGDGFIPPEMAPELIAAVI